MRKEYAKKNMDRYAYMDPTHRKEWLLILNGKNFLLIYSLTLSIQNLSQQQGLMDLEIEQKHNQSE